MKISKFQKWKQQAAYTRGSRSMRSLLMSEKLKEMVLLQKQIKGKQMWYLLRKWSISYYWINYFSFVNVTNNQ